MTIKQNVMAIICALVIICSCAVAEAICTEDNPGCDTPWHLSFSINAAVDAATANGYTVTSIPNAICYATSCHVGAWLGGGSYLTTDCYDFVLVAWCDHQVCDLVDDNSWLCHDVPPLGIREDCDSGE